MYSWTLTLIYSSNLMYYKMCLHKWVTTMVTNYGFFWWDFYQPSEDIKNHCCSGAQGVESYINCMSVKIGSRYANIIGIIITIITIIIITIITIIIITIITRTWVLIIITTILSIEPLKPANYQLLGSEQLKVIRL